MPFLPLLLPLTTWCRAHLTLLSTDRDFASAASRAGNIPSANSLINVNLTCDGGEAAAAGDDEALLSLCSKGSTCLDGDLGVYCQCYMRESTLNEVRPRRGAGRRRVEVRCDLGRN